MQHLVADCHILAHLGRLNVLAQLVLVLDNICFKQSHLPHEIFVHLVLVNFTALSPKQLHLFLDRRENQNLFVFVQHAIASLIEHINELLWRLQSEQIVDLGRTLVKEQLDVRFI